MSEQKQTGVMLSNPEDRRKLQEMLREAALCKQRVADENRSVTELANNAKKEYGIDVKVFRKLIPLVSNPDLSEFSSEFDEVEYLFETVVKPSVFKSENNN